MKLPTIILSTVLLFCASILSAQDTDKDIKQIRKEYQRINKARLTTKIIHWENDIEECLPPYLVGSVTYYYEKNKLVKINSEGGEDHGEWNEEYYFKDGKLFFIYQYNAWGGAENPTYNTLQLRIYIKDDEAIKTLQTSSVKDLETLSADEIEEFIKTANALRTAITKEQVTKILSCAGY